MKYAITPVPKPRMTQRDRWKKRPCVLRYRAFKDKCRLLRVRVPDRAKVTFWMPMPRSWPELRRQSMEGAPHQQTPDIDNLCKALLDALYGNDSHVAELTIVKRWGRKGAIEVTA